MRPRKESKRLTRARRIFARVVEMHDGHEAGATEWMETSIPALGNHSPLELVRTEAGALRVDDLIGQIEHGIVA